MEIGEESSAWPLQNRLGQIHRQRLLPLLDRCLTEASAPDRIHRIESLVVDLGEVDLDNLERDLEQRLDERLRPALRDQISQAEGEATRREGGPGVASRLELLAFFVQTGRLPWWADGAQPDLLDRTLEILARDEPRALVAWLRRLIRGGRPPGATVAVPRALRRLVLHYDDERLMALLGGLVTSPEPRPRELEELLQARHAITRVAPEQFRNAVWSAALQTACSEAPGTAESFWTATLVRLASELGSSLRPLMKDLSGVLDPASSDPATRLTEAIRSLAEVIPGEERRSRPPDLAPADDPRALRARNARHSQPEKPADPPGELRQEKVAESPTETPGEPTPRLGVTPREAAPASFDLAFSETDVAYVDNAGLVVLWPFLSHFFERLGLMTDKTFHHPAAVHRAVGLLQVLVTQDPRPAEHQVTLGKVLCGMGVDEIFDFGPPISPEEVEESSHLLTAVIERAPILKRMSVAGFRRTFLLRQGVLSVRDGAWLLRVEREAYDVVLDRFPWSVGWIKLAWMEASLQVEW